MPADTHPEFSHVDELEGGRHDGAAVDAVQALPVDVHAGIVAKLGQCTLPYLHGLPYHLVLFVCLVGGVGGCAGALRLRASQCLVQFLGSLVQFLGTFLNSVAQFLQELRISLCLHAQA